jgi:CDP-glycerol:poly(glycerophosphate) glycerophosphotransferase
MNYSRAKYLLTSGNLIKKGKRKFFKKFLQRPFSAFVYFFPIKENRIVFDNFGGKGYGDNPKYIADELAQSEKDYEMIWLVDNLSSYEFPMRIRAVKIDSFMGLYMRATAKVWIDNVRHLHPVKKKEKQIYLQTWHAPFGPKRAEADAEKELGEEYVREAKYDGQIADGILSNSKLLDNQFKRAFWLSDHVEILSYGLPRNDFFIKQIENDSGYYRLRKQLNFEKDCFYILYAPTFRDNYSLEGYKLEYEEIVKKFAEKVNKKAKIIVRLHPNVWNQSDFINYGENILNGTSYPDMQELLLACDALISDYSSCVFDFAILKKPVFLCALDIKEYEKTRGLLPEFYNFPFPMATSNEEMIRNIKNYDQVTYFAKINQYFEKYPLYDDGNATKRVVAWLEKKLNEK